MLSGPGAWADDLTICGYLLARVPLLHPSASLFYMSTVMADGIAAPLARS